MTEAIPREIDARLAEFVRSQWRDDSTLVEVGIDSLTAVRIVVGLLPDDDAEIDAARLGGIRTVGQFRQWLRDLLSEQAGVAR
ncbi:hypothetical protein SAMN05421805_111126 [Saccharopolyspora antimicrobica]|uniref:Acyl carrier protein n=1 Tax=Saccharopolyspora antimicrobica TaxID=455193 RepID=A0A1I5FKP7_9PSEU|nr:hypothetical protein [Saccharopolyspora antimicrobica]RKT82210.1 hypothetical protein ATL45_0454 [Saccharopolyspora antimicrobica]SFO24357.1 hypothetical protein SAMN05421805_111126 [Saccharopolyspora antimicrobica]